MPVLLHSAGPPVGSRRSSSSSCTVSRCWPPVLLIELRSPVGRSRPRSCLLCLAHLGPPVVARRSWFSRSVARQLTSRWSAQPVIHQHSVISHLEDIRHRCKLISAPICLVRHPASRRRSQSQPSWHPPCCWPGTATGSHTERSRSPPRTFTPQTFRNGGGGPPMRVCRDDWIELN